MELEYNLKENNMKQVFLIIILFFSTIVYISAQENLVYNGDFEEYWMCPDKFLFFPIKGWSRKDFGTPDYYNTCCKDTMCAIPCNWSGCYYPKSGNAYIGLFLFSEENTSMERISGFLIEPMIKGKKYKVSFWVRLAYQFSDYAAYNIGIYFSNDSIIFKNQHYITFNHKYIEVMSPELRAHIGNPMGNYIKDTNWVEISGIYTAQGGEQYFAIGMYWDDNPKVVEAFYKAQKSQDWNIEKKFGKVVAKNTFIKNKYMEKKYKKSYAKGGQHFPYYLIDDVSVIELNE